MLTILNLTHHPLTPQQIEAARTTTLDRIDPRFRRDVAQGLHTREVRQITDLTAAEWERAAVIPWVDVRQSTARGLLDAVNAARGYDWPVGVTVGEAWWVIHGWDDLDRVVGGST